MPSVAESVLFSKRMSHKGLPAKKNKNAKELAHEWKQRKASDMARFKQRPSGALSNEQIAAAKRIFATIDHNNSGTIEMEELMAWLRSMGKQTTPEQVKAIMATVDGREDNEDNKLDLREFLDLFHEALRPPSQKEEELDGIKEVLEKYGDSGKQQIKKQDLLKILNEHYGLEVDAAYVDILMKEVWKNSPKGSAADLDESLDEFVTLDELRKALAL